MSLNISSRNEDSEESPKEQNAFFLFAEKFYKVLNEEEKIQRPEAMKKAGIKWEKGMTNEEKIPWYKLFYNRKLLKKIEKDNIPLDSTKFELITSTYNSPFVIEPLSLMVTEIDECTKLFNEFINFDCISDN